MVRIQHGPDGSGLIWAIRSVIAVQVVAALIAIALAAPDFIDRLQRPSSCIPGCIDVRGLVFIFLLIVLTPVVLTLTAAALLLRSGRIWPAWMALAVNLLVIGIIASGVMQLITGASSCSDMCESFDYGHVPVLVQEIEVVLLAIPPLATLVFTVLFVSWPLIKPSRTRSTASASCPIEIPLASPACPPAGKIEELTPPGE